MSKLNYKTDERSIESQFDCFGEIKRVKLIKDKNGKSKGYCFIEYHETRCAEIAYKRGDGRKVDGKRVLVDKEQARIDRHWLPRRLGGGKGGESRRNRDEESYVKEIRKELREQQDQVTKKLKTETGEAAVVVASDKDKDKVKDKEKEKDKKAKKEVK